MPSNILEVGDEVAERYRIVSELGRGGMGAVFVAEDNRFDELVALKVATAAGAAYDDFKSRFMREARIGNMLGQNAGFVRAFDWGTLDDGRTLYLAMDLVPDAQELDLVTGTLEERLKRLAQAARLVAGCHAAGVIHRDLKPGNFFQAADGELWLGDFGLAKVITDSDDSVASALLTQSGMGMGTPFFMPPEQFENVKDVGTKADVYALGAMLFYLLTQRYPYEGESAGQILSAQMKVRYGQSRQPKAREFDPTIPRELDKLCWEATAILPKRRLKTAEEFADRIERFLRDGPAEATPDRATAQTVANLQSGDAIGGPVGVSQPPHKGRRAPVLLESGVVAGSRGPERHQSSLLPVTLAVGTFVLLGGFYVASTRTAIETPVANVATAEVDKPRAETYQWLERLVEKGDVPSMLKLAAMHKEDGNGDESVRLYRKAAKQGNVRAMITMGKLFEDGGPGVEQSDYMAKHWFKQAVDAGDDRAKLLLQAVEDREEAKRVKAERDRQLAAAAAHRKQIEARRRAEARNMVRRSDPPPARTATRRRTHASSRTYWRPKDEYHRERCKLTPKCLTPTVCKREGRSKGYGAEPTHTSRRSSRTARRRSTRSSYESRLVAKYGGKARKPGEYHTSSCRAHPTCKSSYACRREGLKKTRAAGPGNVRRYGYHTNACKLRPKCLTPSGCRRAGLNRYKDKTITIGGPRRRTSETKTKTRKRDSASYVTPR